MTDKRIEAQRLADALEKGTAQFDSIWTLAKQAVQLLRQWPEPGELGWMPIESAPKEYLPPLSPYGHYAPGILGLWGKAFYCVCSWGGPSQPYWIDGNNRKIPFQPTHWKPLPPPPGAAAPQAVPQPQPLTDEQLRKLGNKRAIFQAGRDSYQTPAVAYNTDDEAWDEYLRSNGITAKGDGNG